MMRFFPSDAAAWASLRSAGMVVGEGAQPTMQPSTPPTLQIPVQATERALPDHKVAERGDPVTVAGSTPITERKAEVLGALDALVTRAIARYGKQVADTIASGVFLRDEQATMRVPALGAHLDALLRLHPEARSRDWLTPALQATAPYHPSHRERALQQVLRPALSSTLGLATLKATLQSILRSLEGADGEARRATFAALVRLLSMPHRQPADALALLEAAYGVRTGIAYDDAALLVGAALRRLPDRPVPAMGPVACAALALLDADNLVDADHEPIVNLGIELGRQARSAAGTDRFEVLLEGVAVVAPVLRAEQLWELARGCLSGLGGTRIDLAQRDAWIACALRLDATLPVPALHGLWEGTALSLLTDGAPQGGTPGAPELPSLRSQHMGALVAAALQRADEPLKASAILSAAAAASNKLHEGPGTLGDLLGRVADAQPLLSTATAFMVGCGLARGCWSLKDGIATWEQAQAASVAPGRETKERDSKGKVTADAVGGGWRFACEPDTSATGAGVPGLEPADQAVLAWSVPGVLGESNLPRHVRWLAQATLSPGQRVALATQLLEMLEGPALRQVFAGLRDVLAQACKEADAMPGPKTGPRPLLLRAMNELMLAYDRWLTEPDLQDRRTVRAQLAEISARKDLHPILRLMVVDRLELHLGDTKAGPHAMRTVAPPEDKPAS